ncbi:MAG TPA: hypothetical protein VG889_12940 [Rhizomicrobium sp.]|nr:hypothetical protein [Rhizomicrobium sp.]
MLWMNPGRMMAGYVALIAPLLLTLFALVTAVSIGWRNWFGVKPPPPKKPDDKKTPNANSPARPRSRRPPGPA